MPDKTQESVNLSPPAPSNGTPIPPEQTSVDEEELARRELARLSLTNEELLKIAAKCPPPPEYFEGDEEMPFDPIED